MTITWFEDSYITFTSFLKRKADDQTMDQEEITAERTAASTRNSNIDIDFQEEIREKLREGKGCCDTHMPFFAKLENAVRETRQGVFNTRKRT